ncbi:hypothetical protein [Virgibacillus sp. CBA3643]|uniref:hypothetical protein n=1 Tax=Virgibacillus sp. CBA3643 TaxID=2942278 RepID=UPI0035A2F9B0
MKKMIILLGSVLVFAIVLAGCGDVEPDYKTDKFETALNEGKDLEGKTVSVEVNKIVPDSAFGYNIQTGEHLNFVSSDNPNVEKGDKLILKVKEVKSTLGSFIITYEKQ